MGQSVEGRPSERTAVVLAAARGHQGDQAYNAGAQDQRGGRNVAG
jgi:hypothetical protein